MIRMSQKPKELNGGMTVKVDKRKLPEGWKWVKLGEVLAYEQPNKYIVKDEQYDKRHGIPVLTPGKTFILGFTQEHQGIYNNIPVIIFDDFTTESRYIAFPFKLKSSAVKILRSKCNFVNLYYVYNSMQLLNFKPGSEHKRFWISEYSKFLIPLPPLPEQRKIAEILETIDNAIEKTDAIIEKYKRIKQGLMQDLLTKGVVSEGEGESERWRLRNENIDKFKDSPLGRIPEEWEVVRLGEVIEEVNERKGKTNISTVLTVSNTEGLVDQTEFFGRNLSSKDTSNYKIVNKWCFVYNPARINVGSIALNDSYEYAIVSPMYSVFKTKEFLLPKYLSYWVQLPNFRYMVINNTAGSVRESLNFSRLTTFKLPLPPLSEQQKIAEILETIDNAIEKTDKIKEKLERIKKGLMEDLLTGKVRVNHLIEEGNKDGN